MHALARVLYHSSCIRALTFSLLTGRPAAVERCIRCPARYSAHAGGPGAVLDKSWAAKDEMAAVACDCAAGASSAASSAASSDKGGLELLHSLILPLVGVVLGAVEAPEGIRTRQLPQVCRKAREEAAGAAALGGQSLGG